MWIKKPRLRRDRHRTNKVPPPTDKGDGSVVLSVVLFIVGFGGTVAAVLFLSAFVYLMTRGLEGTVNVAGRVTGAAYILAFVGVIALMAKWVRSLAPGAKPRGLILGILIGLGLSCLVEGICFNVG